MITLQEGKCYRTRDGRKAEVLERATSSLYPHVGTIDALKFSWTENGSYFHPSEEAGQDGRDLVAEWPDEPASSPDPVSAPAHYTSGTIECIDAIEAMLTVDEFRGFLRGNIVKYQWRYRQKGGAQDLDKSSWYLDRLKRLEATP